jgi:RNA-dependent RNA polymerase
LWLARADKEGSGACARICSTLAKIHSRAVDYQKTGEKAVLSYTLRTGSYPGKYAYLLLTLDFMENKHKAVYESENIIGQLYREVLHLCDPKITPTSNERVLHVTGSENYMKEAKILFRDFNFALTRLMNSFGVKTEFEIITGNIIELHKHIKNAYDLREKICMAYETLRDEYWVKFNERSLSEDEKLKKAWAWYMVANTTDDHTFKSFGWIPYSYLVKVFKEKH